LVTSYDFVIVGAGIVGLSVAKELAKRHPRSLIAILEKESDIGRHASGRNSGVMHSGVYYGSTTLKAKVCSLGAARMRAFADENGIACQKVGKVIIATSEKDLPTLEKLLINAKANGVKAERLDTEGIREIEPNASAHKAGIYCPDTAVIDSRAVIEKLREILEHLGVKFVFKAVINQVFPDKRSVHTSQGNFSYGFLYNCAGAGADLVAKMFGHAEDYTLVPFKGIYYKLKDSKKELVKGNIYPVPDIELPFLGVHLTRVISGDVYVGPTAIPALGRENYGLFEGIKLFEGYTIGRQLLSMYKGNRDNFRRLVHEEMRKYYKPYFVSAAKKLMNRIKASDLEASNKVGIRPQLINLKTRALEMDYIIEKDQHTLHVLNSISPAFTSSLAFCEWIVDQAEGAVD
jgi:(S)-2-hydroxyglutarate dehydrogenase